MRIEDARKAARLPGPLSLNKLFIRFLFVFVRGWLLSRAALAQNELPSASFELAVIKPATLGRVQGKLHIGMKIEGDRVDIGFMSIEELIQKAYGVRSYQVAGPQWIMTEHFDILAKIPAGSGKDQVAAMLRSLLAERFQLRLHRQATEHSVYALVAGKTGAKLTPAAPAAAPEPPESSGSDLSFNGSVSSYRNGKQRGMKITTQEGGTIFMSRVNGNQRIEGEEISLPQLAYTLSEFTDRPVVDKTGIAGSYRIQFEISLAEAQRRILAGRAAASGIQERQGLPAPAGMGASDPPGGPSVFDAVQRLGLKLEPRKEMIETLVVDQVEKTPTDN